MVKKNQETALEKVREEIILSTIGTILSFILSLGFISGASYVLLEAKSEIIKLERNDLEFSHFGDEEDRLYALNEEAALSRDLEFQNKMKATIAYFSDHKEDDKLDFKFKSETIRWYLDATIELSGQKGKISGYVITNEIYRTYQNDLIDLYSTYQSLLDQSAEMIYHWEEENVRDREDRFLEITYLARTSREKLGAVVVEYEQILDYLTYTEELLTQEYNENIELIHISRTRLELAWLGISLGLLTLTGVTVVTVKTYLPLRNRKKR